MPSNKKRSLNERAYRTNVLPDGMVARIEGLEDANLMPENTDAEQVRRLREIIKPEGSIPEKSK